MSLRVALASSLLTSCYLPIQPQGGYAGDPQYAQPAPPGGPEAAPMGAPTEPAAEPAQAGPQNYSLDLKNECRETVNLFIGDRPPFSSGTYTTLGSNTSTSYTGFAPETIWIVDDSRNPVSSYSVGAGSQRVQILESCTGFAPR